MWCKKTNGGLELIPPKQKDQYERNIYLNHPLYIIYIICNNNKNETCAILGEFCFAMNGQTEKYTTKSL